MKQSLWQETYTKKSIRKNTLPTKTDICIIGGGITGLSLAYFLKDSKQQITLLEKDRILEQTTAKTTAKISFLQQDVYSQIKKQSGMKKSHQYYQSQKEAISLLVDIIKTQNINCDLEEVSSILFALDEDTKEKVKEEESLLNSFHEKTIPIKNKNITYGFKVKGTYVYHPLKYLSGLIKTFSKETSIHEHTLVYQITPLEEGYQVLTDKGSILAKDVVVACHYPFFIFPMLTPLKTYMKRSYVFSGKVMDPKEYTAINLESDLHSIRFYKDEVIYNCKEHLLTDLVSKEKAYQQGKNTFCKLFQTEPTASWINQDIYSHDHLPFIGRLREHLYIATAYGGWGMSNGTLAGKLIANLILTGNSKYEDLFSPTRFHVSLLVSSIVGSMPYIKGYLSPVLSKEKLKKTKINGKNCYVKEEDGKKNIVKTKCPHMKCPLLYNEVDETWDCPCHGSRFTKEGMLLVGPSKKNIVPPE